MARKTEVCFSHDEVVIRREGHPPVRTAFGNEELVPMRRPEQMLRGALDGIKSTRAPLNT
jgi:hypothetical protein